MTNQINQGGMRCENALSGKVRVTFTQRDFSEFAKALSAGFKPNRALNSALTTARKSVRRG
jgi:uncharacterized protein (DUF1778 family)